MRDRKVRMARVDVDRRNIDFNLRGDFLQIETTDAMGVETEPGFEFDSCPSGVFADLQRKFFGADSDARLLPCYIGLDLERHTHFVAGLFCERIVRAWNIGMIGAIKPLDGNAHSAFAKFVVGHAGGTKAKSSLAAFQIGHAHSGEQHSWKFFWREGHGYSYHRAKNPSFAEPLLERISLPLGF